MKVRDDMLLLLLFKFTIKKKGRSERSEDIQIKIHISSTASEGMKLSIDDYFPHSFFLEVARITVFFI